MNNVTWNQKWALPAIVANATTGVSSGTGRITTTKSLTTYCLRSPLSTLPAQYVVVLPCPSGALPANMTWTVYTDARTYATSYQIVDSSGFCLQPTDPTVTPPDLFSAGQQIGKLVVAACSGSTLQKWNAPANILASPPLKDIGES
jgi:hypothetical protein